jgi:hypothetical protein
MKLQCAKHLANGLLGAIAELQTMRIVTSVTLSKLKQSRNKTCKQSWNKNMLIAFRRH